MIHTSLPMAIILANQSHCQAKIRGGGSSVYECSLYTISSCEDDTL